MLTTASITIQQLAPALPSPGLLFATPLTSTYNATIYDADGSPVWIAPSGETATDLRVQQYRGRPVLTYWAGRIQNTGNGQGRGVILDTSYRLVAEVFAGSGMLGDLHEFELTERGTALVTAFPVARADLSGIGGPQAGWIYDCHVEEIDIPTGRVLFNWRASHHIHLDESYQQLGTTGSSPDNPYDAYHFNAISADSDNTLLLSARHTHALYSLDRATGAIRWRMGGRRSDFTIEPTAAFAWQHHARRRSASEISLFDNHEVTPGGTSRGLLLRVDEQARNVGLIREFARSNYLGVAMGSVQVLENGNVLVGWGTQNAATEFSADGIPVWEVQGLGLGCYRVFRQTWTGLPATDPDIAVHVNGPEMTVYASWNGATQVATWRVLAGASDAGLATAVETVRSGFETASTISRTRAVRVQALDASGGVLGQSRILYL